MKQLYTLALFTILLSLTSHSQVVINEIYGGGGNSGATYKNDFIELYNNGSTAVDLTGWSVQYASSTGTTWQVTNLAGTIQPHGYYLIKEAQGSGGTVDLPFPDATGTISMSGTAGKVALVNGTTALTGTCPTGTAIVDFVGFGTTANCFEGTGPTPAPSNTTSVQRILSGNTAQDTNINSADFVAGAPSPSNSGGNDVTPPAISSLQPASGSTNLQTSFTAVVNFSENIVKGSTGTITVKKSSDNSIVQSTAITSPAVVVSGNTVALDLYSLAFSTGYYIEISSDAVKDASNNYFAGISGSSSWNFTTAATAPVGTMGTTYSFATCSNTLSDGFTQYSVTGDQKWGCTSFGRDPANAATNLNYAVQINGYLTTNVPNEDWLISPAFDLTGTTYPLLSFWSRTKFNGEALHLKISTDYTGTGDPRLATWTDLNGRFPNQTSDVWTLSENINLSAFKQAKVFLTWVYISTDEEGARWTLDDITITNSSTPPPPSITVNSSDVLFNYVAPGATMDKTITILANDITAPVIITAPSPFLVSKDGTTFSSTVTYTTTEANNILLTLYTRFAPTEVNKSYTGILSIATAGATTTLTLKGTTVDPANTLEVVNWNIDWFGSIANGPADDALQELNVKTVLQNTKADIYGLVEVVSETRLASVVSQMPGYAYVIGNYGSHVNPPDPTGGSLAEAQKLAFVYKTSMFSNVSTRPMINNTNTTSASYINWSAGRYPFLLKADVTLNGVTKTINFILIHAKANTSPTSTSYTRRKTAVTELHDTLLAYFPNDNYIILGDFNDDLDSTITDGISPKITSYSAFTLDNMNNFYSPTLSLSLAGKKSTAKYNDVIDHVIVSNKVAPYVMQGSTTILTDVASYITNYSTTTTDHYPVFTRYAFDALIVLPSKLLDFTAVKQGSSVNVNWIVNDETNSDKYIVERSNDGVQFTPLASVLAKDDGSTRTVYSFMDVAPQKGINLYRLKQVYHDDKFEYSRQVPVVFDVPSSITISPNPATTEFNVRLDGISGPLELRLLNASGKLMKMQMLAGTYQKVDVSSLAKGIYFVQIISNKKLVQSSKLIIER
ncbi:MAG: lamin tail domain-containing protein [Candidatus Dadabacteria bacterium]